MADLRRRVSQLAGMAERYDIADSGREGRLISEMVGVLRELALDVEEVTANQMELEHYVEELDSDLMSLEDVYFDDGEEDGEGIDGEAEYIELECPVCAKDTAYNSLLFEQDGIQLVCPHCGNVVFDGDEDYIVMQDDDEDEDDR